MDTIPYSEFRRNLKTYMDKVCTDNSPLLITRKNNRNVILLSIDEYNNLMETNYLMSSEANYKYLSVSIDQYERGRLRRKI